MVYDLTDGELAPGFANDNDDLERYFDDLADNVENNLREMTDDVPIEKIYNGSNELVKICHHKCVFCLDKDSVYAFRQCGHQCFCEECFNPEINKCVVCRT